MRKLKIIFYSSFLAVIMSFTACGNSNLITGTIEQQGTNATLRQQETNASEEQQGTNVALGQQDTSAALEQQGTNAALGQQSTSAASEPKQETSQYDNNKYASIADYVASDEVQKSIELLSGMEGLDIKIKADGNKMIYEYTYTTITKMDGMDEELKKALDKEKDTFTKAASDLKKQVKVDNPIVTVTYLDKNGDLIYSQDFPAN